LPSEFSSPSKSPPIVVAVIPDESIVTAVPTLMTSLSPSIVILEDPTVNIPVILTSPSTINSVVPLPIVTALNVETPETLSC